MTEAEPTVGQYTINLETLESYRERYRPVAGLAGMAREFDAAGPLEIVEDKVGTGSTDFWGISFSPAATEQGPMGEAELERGITLLRACWTFFDGAAARVSPQMRKGPRGGGRDRDQIIRHTIRTESEDFAKQVGLRVPEGAALTPDGLRQHRESYVAAEDGGQGPLHPGRGLTHHPSIRRSGPRSTACDQADVHPKRRPRRTRLPPEDG